MIHMGSWLTTEMTDVIAELPEPFRLGMFDFPAYDGGEGDQNSLFGTAQTFSIAEPAKTTSHEVNVPLAVEYLKRWTSLERANERSDKLKMIPATAGANAPTIHGARRDDRPRREFRNDRLLLRHPLGHQSLDGLVESHCKRSSWVKPMLRARSRCSTTASPSIGRSRKPAVDRRHITVWVGDESPTRTSSL